jgi:flagellar biosynthesis/type III secretory pathway protein FliH
MRNQFRGNGSHMGQEVGFREAYREGYREGYEQAMRDAHEGGMDLEKMTPAEREAYLRGQRDAYGRNGAENRNQL